MRGSEGKTFSDYTKMPIQDQIDEKVKQEKKILKFWFALIYVGSLFLAAIFWRSADAGSEVVNVISIGAGLMSIGLAVGAMIYAHSQSSVATEQNSQVQGSLQQIRDHVIAFSSIRNEFSNFREDFLTAISQISKFNQDALESHEQISKSITEYNKMKDELADKLPDEGNDTLAKGLQAKIDQIIQETQELKKKSIEANQKVGSYIQGSIDVVRFKNSSITITIIPKADIDVIIDYISEIFNKNPVFKFNSMIYKKIKESDMFEISITYEYEIGDNKDKNNSYGAALKLLSKENDFYDILHY